MSASTVPRDDRRADEIQRADPRARARLAIVIAVVVTLGVLLRILFGAYLEIDANNVGENITRLRTGIIVLWLMVLPMLYFGVVTYGIGRRTIASQRFPPPGTPVVKDTVVHRGAAARRRGYAIQIMAVMLMMIIVSVPVTVSLMVRRLLPGI